MACRIEKARNVRMMYLDGLILDVELRNHIANLVCESESFEEFTAILKAAAGVKE